VLKVAAVMLLSAAFAGCGNSRTPVPNLSTPVAPNGFRTLTFRAAGLELQAPSNWVVSAGRGRLVTVLSSGAAVVALWRFPRSSAPPSSFFALQDAAQVLVDSDRARDPGLRLISTNVTRIDGVPAVEINAVEQIAGHTRRVRSSHLYMAHAEIVLDEYAPPQLFPRVARAVFTPVNSSLRVNRKAT
jgi:hypothetical protein